MDIQKLRWRPSFSLISPDIAGIDNRLSTNVLLCTVNRQLLRYFIRLLLRTLCLLHFDLWRPLFFRFVSFVKKQLLTQRHQHMPGCGERKWLRYYGHPCFRKANNPNPQAADSTRTRDSVSIFFSLFKTTLLLLKHNNNGGWWSTNGRKNHRSPNLEKWSLISADVRLLFFLHMQRVH